MRWKGRLAPRVVTQPADVTDLFPTILDLAGVHAATARPLDGRSILPYLEGDEGALNARRIYRYAHPGWISGDRPWTPEGLPGEYSPVDKATLPFDRQALALRDGRYKLLQNPLAADHGGALGGPHVFLVDLEEDPREQTNLAEKEPQRTAEMLAELRSWWDGILAEEASFQPTVFPVGFEGHATTAIKACGPRAVEGGVANSFNSVAGWRAGGKAHYQLDVHTAGEYEATVEFIGKAPWDVAFTVGTPAGRGRLRIDPEGQETPARITLPAGPVVLTVELEHAGDADRTAQARMSAVVLRRR